MFIEIGANSNKAKGTAFFNSNNKPIQISRIPTIGNAYPVARKEDIKSLAFAGNSGMGIKLKAINLLSPKKSRIRANTMRRILVKVEFIGMVLVLC